MMNLPERIALSIFQHLSRLTEADRTFAPIKDPEKYWVLRNQVTKIVEDHLLDALREERYQ